MAVSKKDRLKRVPSKVKSDIANTKPRVGGKFVSADPEKAAKAIREKEEQELIERMIKESDMITDEDREYIGTDSAKFFERAMQRSLTYYEGAKYAKELKPIQHPSLQSIQSKVDLEVTEKVLRWQWDAPLIESEQDETKAIACDANTGSEFDISKLSDQSEPTSVPNSTRQSPAGD